MMRCEEVRASLHGYLDSELTGGEVTAIESHLLDCDGCREEHRRWREVVDAVRGSQAYRPSPGSADRVRALLIDAERMSRRRWLAQAAAVAVVAGGGAAAWLTGGFGAQGESFRVYAAESHLRHSRGRLSLDIASTDPAELTGWLEANLPFHLEVPAYPSPTPGSNAYELVGARLLRHAEADVAFLAYKMEEQAVSLLVGPAEGRRPVGGDVYRSGELDFHFYSLDGLKLIGWVDDGLSYVIVSSVDAVGAESCVVCHGQGAERKKFEALEPAVHR